MNGAHSATTLGRLDPDLKSVEPRSSVLSFFVQRLGRVTSGGRFVPCIDGLRCLAIVAVLAYHLNGYLVEKATGVTEVDARKSEIFSWLHGANCGVQIFFTISGFILALPFARERMGSRVVVLKDYYIRRLTRLEPPFIANLVLIFILLLYVKRESLADLFWPLLATMTYLHNVIYGELSRINGVTWSLEIEVQFYMVAPFLLRAYFGKNTERRRVGATFFLLALIAIKALVNLSGELRLRLGLLYVFDHFLAGIIVADLFVFRWHETPQQSKRWDLLTIPLLALIFGIQRSDVILNLLPLATMLLMVCVFRGKATNWIFSTTPIVIVGGMCYSIYLYHFFAISLIGRFTLPLTAGLSYQYQLLAQLAVIFPAVLVICAFFFITIERPFMQWRPGRRDLPAG